MITLSQIAFIFFQLEDKKMSIVYLTSDSSVSNTGRLPKSWQTTEFYNGDDGHYQRGITFPSPRFTVQDSEDCVKDNMTGLYWTLDGNLNDRATWSNQIIYCEALDLGGYTDWRLPNINEMFSLMDTQNGSAPLALPTFPTGHPFINIKSRYLTDALAADGWADLYWTSTTSQISSTNAYWYQLWDAYVRASVKTSMYLAWPVRGG